MIYKVVNAENLRSLEAMVNLSLLGGWELAGSLIAQPIRERPINSPVFCISENGLSDTGKTVPSTTNWCQPMVNRHLVPKLAEAERRFSDDEKTGALN